MTNTSHISTKARALGLVIIALVIGLSLALAPSVSYAASAQEIDIRVNDTIKRFKRDVGGATAFMASSKGVLVFPKVIKAGFGIGGEYGEGAMRIGGKTVEYYSTAAASIGFQIGAQTKSIILIFLDKGALRNFRNSSGWEVGVDGSVALVEMGAGGTIDTTNIKDPIVAFIFGQKGLMYNLTLEGSKFTKLKR